MKNATEVMSTPSSAAVSNRFPIRVLAAMTGVNPGTLRAWERRYGLLNPKRTNKGHRLYDTDDAELVQRVTAFLNDGIPISLAAQLARDADASPLQGDDEAQRHDVWSRYHEQMLAAIAAFSMPTLERIFNEGQAYYPSDLITSRLIAPLLNTLGMRWQTDAGGIAEEHFFSVFIRNKLGARFHHLAQDGKRGILVTACLPGEFHDLGVMLFGLSAASRGYRLIQLGANMPLAETAIAAHRAGANGIVLSGSANVWSPLLGAELAQLAINIDLPILIGGVIVESYRQELNDCGVHILGRELPQAMAILERKVK